VITLEPGENWKNVCVSVEVIENLSPAAIEDLRIESAGGFGEGEGFFRAVKFHQDTRTLQYGSGLGMQIVSVHRGGRRREDLRRWT